MPSALGVFGWCTSEVDIEKVFTGSLVHDGEQPWCRNGCINIWAKAFRQALASGVAAPTRTYMCFVWVSFGIGEAQVYLGGVDDAFGCHLASVKPRCIWAGLMISLGVIWHR